MKTTSSEASNDSVSEPNDREQRIEIRAFELYLQRGSNPGSDIGDWLQAEAEISAEQEIASTAGSASKSGKRSVKIS